MDLTVIFCAIDYYYAQQKINWNGKILSSLGTKKKRKISAKSERSSNNLSLFSSFSL